MRRICPNRMSSRQLTGRGVFILCLAVVLSSLSACGKVRTETMNTGAEEAKAEEGQAEVKETPVEPPGILIDYYGHTESFEICPMRVAALSGSLGEVWLEAGGELAGITDDAVEERNLALPENIRVVGSIKNPDLETVIDLQPDLVILSADIDSHRQLALTLERLEIPYGLFHEESFQDYLVLLKQFTELTGRSDLYEERGEAIRQEICDILAQVPSREGSTVLLLRAYSNGFRAKGSEELAGTMLRDLGLENLCDRTPSLLEEFSVEAVTELNPDFLAVTFMGDEEASRTYFEQVVLADPLWQSLTAVQKGRVIYLPKDLFHYKPNERWAESYRVLAELLQQAEERK